ncbi:hypothetical protein GCM10010492_74610 [Saccharothrix mutabilis subsp. mutabilis]|uniref:DUF3558 domain-containing protein n=1 Tax=Saccharothrix mutabilis subsp. mutabilis TaxID=66855 RepID=A0ABN0UVH8_9PSEU
MTRLAARSAWAAALVALAFTAACSPAPAEPDPTPTSTRTIPSSLPKEVADMWAEKVESPKKTAEDLCGLLTVAEVTAAVGVEAAEGVANGPGKCAWSIGGTVDAKGRPDAGVLLTTPKPVAWLGDKTTVSGHPARTSGSGGTPVCTLKVLLREPVEDPDDRPVLELFVVTKGDAPRDQCEAARSLAELALDRLPA